MLQFASVRSFTRRRLLVLVAVFVILGLIYTWITPLFESPDESSHLQVIDYLARYRRLYPPAVPDVRITTGPLMAASLRYHTPPLYYTPPLYHILGAVLTAGIPMDDLAERLTPNPAWDMAWSPQRDAEAWNKNVYAHLPGETGRESPTMRAALVLRTLSVALGALTVVGVFGCAHVIFPHQPVVALTSAALIALNPQFIALAAGVTNDALANAIFALFAYLALCEMRSFQQKTPAWLRWAGLGALVGVGLLTKQSALLLLPLGGLAILGQALGQDPRFFLKKWATQARIWRKIVMDGAALGLGASLVGGSWYIHNALHYGDPLGLQTHFRSQMPLANFGWREMWTVFETYWAGFGWALLSAPGWVYGVIALFVLVAVSGMGRAVLPGGTVWLAPALTRRGLVLLTVLLGMNMLSLRRWAVATGAPYGRLMFLSNAALGVLLAWGLAQWSDVRWVRGARLAFVAGLMWLSVLVPGWILRPAFAAPHVTLPLADRVVPVDAHFVAGPTLLAYDASLPVARTLVPGDALGVTLYWGMEYVPLPRYTTWVHLSPADPTQRIADADAWLGGTHYPSDLWRRPDLGVRQVHQVRVPEQGAPFGLYWLRLGLTPPAGERVPLVDGGSAVTLGPWRVRPVPGAAPAVPVDARLGEAVRLQGYDVAVTDSLVVTLTWSAEAVPALDYVVFVHWVGAEGVMLAQHDGSPAAGRYPSSWWLPGDCVPDVHRLSLPLTLPNPIILYVGMYDPATGARLPAYTASGALLPDGIIPLPVAVDF